MDEYEWHASEADAELQKLLTERAGSSEITIHRKRVHDGELRAIRSCEPPEHRWHLSISHWRRKWGRSKGTPRFPTWEELADARYDLLPANLMVVLYLPPPEEIVEVTDNTLHLWQERSSSGEMLSFPPLSSVEDGERREESP